MKTVLSWNSWVKANIRPTEVSVSRTLNSSQKQGVLFCSWPQALNSLWWRDNKKICISPLGDQNSLTEPPWPETQTSLHFQMQYFLTPARLILSSCLWTTWVGMWSHKHQRVVSCLDLTKTKKSTSLSSKHPTPAGEQPKQSKSKNTCCHSLFLRSRFSH